MSMSQENSIKEEQDNTKPNQRKTDLEALFHEVARAEREHGSLVKQLLKIAKEGKAGKVPKVKEVGRLAWHLARWESEFSSLLVSLFWHVGEAERAGFRMAFTPSAFLVDRTSRPAEL
jgi:hypothetical protein